MNIKEVLINKNEIQLAIEQIAKKMNSDYAESEEVVFVIILKGAIVFASDLMRKINFPVILDFISATSYGSSTKTSGVVKILKDLDFPIEGKDVIIIEDIVDTGLTLSYLKNILVTRRPKSLKICTLLDKYSRRKIELVVDYVGIRIPDKFVVGYGLDWNEKYRYLPNISIVG